MNWRIFYPWLNIAPQKFCAGLSTLFLFGKLKAAGTWGSAIGALFVALVMAHLSLIYYIALTLVLIYLSVGICEVGEKYFNLKDPNKINLDEFIAMPICYFPLYLNNLWAGHFWWWIFGGFLLFRFLDITKPVGVRCIQNLSGGLGCVADDVLAGIYTAIVLQCISDCC